MTDTERAQAEAALVEAVENLLYATNRFPGAVGYEKALARILRAMAADYGRDAVERVVREQLAALDAPG